METGAVDYERLTAEMLVKATKMGTFKVVLFVAQFGTEGTPALGEIRLGRQCGMSHNTARAGLLEAIERGWIEATETKNTYSYRVGGRYLREIATHQKLGRSSDKSDSAQTAAQETAPEITPKNAPESAPKNGASLSVAPEVGAVETGNGNGTPVAVLGTKNSEFSKPLHTHTAHAREGAVGPRDAAFPDLLAAVAKACFGVDSATALPYADALAVGSAVQQCAECGVEPDDVLAVLTDWDRKRLPYPKQIAGEALKLKNGARAREHAKSEKRARLAAVPRPAVEDYPPPLTAEERANAERRTARPPMVPAARREMR